MTPYYLDGKGIYPATCVFCGQSAPMVEANYVRPEGDGFAVFVNAEKFDWAETEEEAFGILTEALAEKAGV